MQLQNRHQKLRLLMPMLMVILKCLNEQREGKYPFPFTSTDDSDDEDV